ncbi:MAG: arsenate reductase ArsC [Desulfobulbaceae bacterium]|nr:arsenate reductase ArsC [Desulfobulbaceae bacterium]
MAHKIKILFLCTGNSCRSQMAEGWAKHLHAAALEPFSAGIEKHGLNPVAVKVMTEVGIDISGQKSKLTTELAGISFDYIVAVCDQAATSCPVFPGPGKIVRRSFPDPPEMAAVKTTEKEKLECYRKVRDEIKDFVKGLPENLLTL